MARRPHQHTLVSARADCQRCPFFAEGNNAQALAAQHFDNKAHQVRVRITTEIVYGLISGKTRGGGGQGSLVL